MDIRLITQSDTADCVITDTYTRKKSDSVITVHSTDSEQHKTAVLNAIAEKDDKTLSEIHYIASLTSGWVNVSIDGKELEFSYENAVLLYKTSSTVFNEVNRFIGNARNFLPKR